MSVLAAITVIVVLDVALLGFLAWVMSHPRHLRPHVPARHMQSARQPVEQRESQLVA